MPKIVKTLLATHDPADILHSHHAIPYAAGDDGSDDAFTFTLPLGELAYPLFAEWRVEATNFLNVAGGLGLTCWGARMEVAGEVDDSDPNSAYLTISNDEFQAGKVVGIDLSTRPRLEIWQIHRKWSWRHGLSHSWEKKVNKDFGEYKFSILSALSDIVAAFITLGDIVPYGDILAALLPQNVDTSGYFDKKSGIIENGGKLSLHPKVVGDISLTQFVTTVAEDVIRAALLPSPPAELLVDLVFALGDIELTVVEFVIPQFDFGPSFGLTSPADIDITSFSVGENRYDTNIVVDKSSSPPRLKGTGTGTQPLPNDLKGQKLEVKFHTKSEYDLLAGLFGEITWLKVLKLHGRKVWTVLPQMQAHVDSTFSNVIGAENLDHSTIDPGEIDSDPVS